MTSSNPYAPTLAPVADKPAAAASALARRKLVPLWIKIFGWIFIVMGVVILLMPVVAPVMGQPASYDVFGLHHRGSPFHPMALAISAIILSLAVSAYGLLFGKPWGLDACLATGYGGVLICLGTMAYTASQGPMMWRLELLVHIPYLLKLHKLRPLWLAPG